MKININDITIGKRHRKETGNIAFLAASIKNLGLLQPIIVTKDNKLIAGKRRILAAKKLGWTTIEAKVIDIEHILEGENAENSMRKDFTNSEKVEVGLSLERLEKEKAKQRQIEAGKKNGRGKKKEVDIKPPANESGKVRDIIAPKIGFKSGKTFDNAKKVYQYAKKHNKRLIDVMNNESIGRAVNQMRREIRDKKNHNEGNKIKSFPDTVNFIQGDFKEVGKKIPDSSIDCIICDPPYSKKFVHLYKDLSELAERVLKQGGFCVVYCGHFYLDKVMANMSEHLMYYHQMIIHYPIDSVHPKIHNGKVKTHYKPVLVYYKPKMNQGIQYFHDLITGTGPDKEYHDWQQPLPEAKTLVEIFSNAGDTILDPMVGSGTTLKAAYELGRKSIGIDIDANCEALTKLRVTKSVA